MDLERFLKAQEKDYEIALNEIKNGMKKSHWMWFIFPQIVGLGHSAISQYYAIQDEQEAKVYVAHLVLGKRLKEITTELLRLENRNIDEIFSFPDNEKLKSSMTLFKYVSDDEIFDRVLVKYFEGEMCKRTVEFIERNKKSKRI